MKQTTKHKLQAGIIGGFAFFAFTSAPTLVVATDSFESVSEGGILREFYRRKAEQKEKKDDDNSIKISASVPSALHDAARAGDAKRIRQLIWRWGIWRNADVDVDAQDVRDYAQKGMADMSRKFREGGGEIYRKEIDSKGG